MNKFLIAIALLLVGAAYSALALLAGANGLTESFLISEIRTATKAVVTMLGLFFLLRLFDFLTGFDFTHWMNEAPHNAKSNYLGYRFIGVCLLLGAIVISSV